MKIFLNGSIVDKDQAVISVFDHGFLYGFGLFETIRAYDRHLFLFEQHYERLRSSAEYYRIRMNKTAAELQNDINQTLHANGLSDAYVRITLTGGDQGLGLFGEEHDEPSWIIIVKPIGDLPKSKKAIFLDLPRATPEGFSRTKSVSFANNMLAKKELSDKGKASFEGIFLNESGFIVEGTVSNLFFVRDGAVYTPHLNTGLLPGVTREFVIRLCHELGIQVEEGFFVRRELEEADEAFITNSIQEIVPVSQVEEVCIRGAAPITMALIDRYKRTIRGVCKDE